MTDRAKKITELTAASSASANDLLIAVTNTSTNAITKSITVGSFFSNVTANTKFSNTVTFTSNVTMSGTLTVNGSTVIAANGMWMGSTGGLKGEVGAKGDVGATGTKGEAGQKGQYGEKGDKGSTGDAGAKGDKGDTGPTGSTGVPGAGGAKGDKGDAGTNGTNGTAGDKGDTGNKGDAGDKGQKGDTGSKGDQGVWGGQTFSYLYKTDTTNSDPGLGGIKFDSYTSSALTKVYIDHVDTNLHVVEEYLHLFDQATSSHRGYFTLTEKANTANYGTFAITSGHTDHGSGQGGWCEFSVVMITGPSDWSGMPNDTPVWASFVVSGDIGDKGEPGVKGDTGAKGDTGTGTKGDKGDAGAKGDTGTGEKGDTGTGTKGDKGDEGQLGATGSKGEPGVKGDTGAKGDKGQGVSTGNLTFSDTTITVATNNTLTINSSQIQVTDHTYVDGVDFSTDVDIGGGTIVYGWSQRNEQQLEIDLFANSVVSAYIVGLSLGANVVITYSTTGGNQVFSNTITQRFSYVGQTDPNSPGGTWGRVSGRIDGTLPTDQTGIVSVNFPTYNTLSNDWNFTSNGALELPVGGLKFDDATVQDTAWNDTADINFNQLTSGVLRVSSASSATNLIHAVDVDGGGNTGVVMYNLGTNRLHAHGTAWTQLATTGDFGGLAITDTTISVTNTSTNTALSVQVYNHAPSASPPFSGVHTYVFGHSGSFVLPGNNVIFTTTGDQDYLKITSPYGGELSFDDGAGNTGSFGVEPGGAWMAVGNGTVSKTWSFGIDGSLTFPDLTTQTTAFAGLIANTTNAPTSASDTGTAGEIRADGDYIYVCVATDTWKRASLSTW